MKKDNNDKKEKNEKNNSKLGRPSVDPTPELIEEICTRVAESTKGLNELCRENPHFPSVRSLRKYIRESEEFSHKYAQAKLDQIDNLVEQILEIADDRSQDTLIKEDRDGNSYEVCNTEWINRCRVRIDTRKWLASKLAPKVYGDKLALTGKDGETLNPIQQNNIETAALVTSLLQKSLKKSDEKG